MAINKEERYSPQREQWLQRAKLGAKSVYQLGGKT